MLPYEPETHDAPDPHLAFLSVAAPLQLLAVWPAAGAVALSPRAPARPAHSSTSSGHGPARGASVAVIEHDR